MRTVPVNVLSKCLSCRGYQCSQCEGEYGGDIDLPQFMLYIEASKRCNARCPFCDIQGSNLGRRDPEFDGEKLREVLVDLYSKNLLSKISITGGEPLLNVKRTSDILRVIFEVNPEAKVDVTTNGSRLSQLNWLAHAHKLSTIHISRHHFDQVQNDKVFGVCTATRDELQRLALKYPGKVSLNCCLVRGLIDSPEKMTQYLDWAAAIKGLKSAGFISLMEKNRFCQENYVPAPEFTPWILEDKDNIPVEENFDTDICMCKTWVRIPASYFPILSFWWEVMRLDVGYCRQLLFTSENNLMVNFNHIDEIPI